MSLKSLSLRDAVIPMEEAMESIDKLTAIINRVNGFII